MNDEEKLPLFSRLNDSIDAGFQRVGEFIADAAQDKHNYHFLQVS